MTSSFQNYFLRSICSEVKDSTTAEDAGKSAVSSLVTIRNPSDSDCTSSSGFHNVDNTTNDASNPQHAQQSPSSSVHQIDQRTAPSVLSLNNSRNSLIESRQKSLPKISFIQDNSLLHILVFLTHLEILQLRLIHPAFNHFISQPEIEKFLCLKKHFVIDLNVYEKNINPSAPMFSLLHTLFPQSLPYYCLCEHFTEYMFPEDFDLSVDNGAHARFITDSEDPRSATHYHPTGKPQRASLIASVHDHFPKEDTKCPIILLKRRKDLHEDTQSIVQRNVHNALILNATGMSVDAVRTFFRDSDKRLFILQLPKFKYNLKKYAKTLRQPHTFNALREALRCSLRRTLYTRHEEAVLYENFQQLREKEWKKYHRKHRRVEQFQTRRAVMYWAFMPVLMPAMNISKHLGFRRGLAAALEDDRGKKPLRVRWKEAAKQGIDKTKHKLDKTKERTKEKVRDIKGRHPYLNKSMYHLNRHGSAITGDAPLSSVERRFRPTNEAPQQIDKPERHDPEREPEMPPNDVEKRMSRMVADDK
eukprot:CAMPEP_0117434680 /NCGR_PEP_ID=MMETSP0759-20121206/76_1 /TAXON_ID=63605 /ORGANISM="Percolomonas cosmopolitus, Strain WS" /LENGTH=530 /DNA_ID=CAMNT_0005226175 /DNA_START=2230 /DNA_END=3822 /DNA_ORIENTATION=+